MARRRSDAEALTPSYTLRSEVSWKGAGTQLEDGWLLTLENRGSVGQLMSELNFEVTSSAELSSVQMSYLSEPLANPGETVKLKLVALDKKGDLYRGGFALWFSYRNRHASDGYERMEVELPAHR